MQLVPDRFEATAPGAVSEASSRLSAGQSAVLQFSSPPYDDSLLREVDELADTHGGLLTVRFYGHYKGGFDFKTLERLPSVVRLSTDCLTIGENVEVLSRLPGLRMLSFGVFELPSIDLLDLLDPNQLEELVIGETRSRRIDLSRISDFRRLSLLRVCAQTRGLEMLGELAQLEKLWLNNIPKKQDFGFVRSLSSLRELHVILGGRESIDEVSSESIEELEVVRVRGLSDFPDLRKFPALRSLRVEDQIRIETIDLPDGRFKLRHLSIHNCKKLSELNGLAKLDQLEELRISRTALDFDALIEAPIPDALDVVALYVGSEKRNKALRAKLDELGFREYRTQPSESH